MAFSSILSGVYLFPNSPVLPSFSPHFPISLTFRIHFDYGLSSAVSSTSPCGPMLPTSVIMSIAGHVSDDGPAPTHHAGDSDLPSVIGEDVG